MSIIWYRFHGMEADMGMAMGICRKIFQAFIENKGESPNTKPKSIKPKRQATKAGRIGLQKEKF